MTEEKQQQKSKPTTQQKKTCMNHNCEDFSLGCEDF